MTVPTVVIGDDFACEVTLQIDGSAHAVTGTVSAAIVSADHARLLMGAVVQSSSTPGADWPAGVVVVVFPASATEEIAEVGRKLIEIQVETTTKSSWFAAVDVVLGHIA